MGCVLVAAGCDWVQWASNASRTGNNIENLLTVARLQSFVPSTVSSSPLTGQATVAGGGLIFGQRNGLLTAYDETTYGIVWTAALPDGLPEGSVPAYDAASKTVFVVIGYAASPPTLLGFDAEGFRNCNTIDNTCRALFVAQVGNSAGRATPPLVDSGRVYAHGGTALHAYDANGVTSCGTVHGTHLCNALWSAPTSSSLPGLGSARSGNTIFAPALIGSASGFRALNAANGSTEWSGLLSGDPTGTPTVSGGRVFVPTPTSIDVFDASGCGSATCTRLFGLARRSADPAGSFLGTVGVAGDAVFGTNSNGAFYKWSTTCGAATCQPIANVTTNAPIGGSTSYSQSPALANNLVFILGTRVISGANHIVLFALTQSNLTEVKVFDLGTASFGAGLSSVSVAWGVLYAPISTGLIAVHAPPVEPLASMTVTGLTLSPAFSPSITDYVVKCATGANNLTFDISAVAGGTVRMLQPSATSPSASQSNPVALNENQAAVIEAKNAAGDAREYWVRCLPADFPVVVPTPHPENGAPTPGYYLTAAFGAPPNITSYAVILNTNGTPVWYRKTTNRAALNVTSTGKNVVTYMNTPPQAWNPVDSIVWDIHNLSTNAISHTRTVGIPTDFHEIQPLDNGNYLLMSYPIKTGVDLTGLPGNPTPGANETIVDCAIQEVTPQGQVVWDWRATDHFDLKTETTNNGNMVLDGVTVYDPVHCNSADKAPNGNVLISARHFKAVFEVRRSDGKVLWKMGGTAVNKDNAQIITIQGYGPGSIALQHDARYRTTANRISLFDNQSQTQNPGRGVEFAINFTNSTATPVFEAIPPNNELSAATGTFRRYSDGHSVVGQGVTQTPGVQILSEVNESAESVLDLAFSPAQAVYRAQKVPPNRYDLKLLRATAGQP
jgi:hypothetical protein